MKSVFLGLGFVYVVIAPLVVAKEFEDTLDLAPYLVCLAVGLGAAIIICLLRWPQIRAGLTGAGPRRHVGLALAAAVACAPTWAVGIGLGINRAFDRSPPTPHACQVIGWRVPVKNRARCLVTSWRGKKAEAIDQAVILRNEPPIPEQSRTPRLCTPGATITVETRGGRLGWAWIERVRKDGL